MTKAKGPTYRTHYRRRREGKTDFSKRLAFIKSGKVRMVVRKSNRFIQVQFIRFEQDGDKTILTFNAKVLAKLYKWPVKRNCWTAYLTGLHAGKKAIENGVTEAILDIGMYVPSNGGTIFAVLKGAIDAGMKMDADESKMPLGKITNPPVAIKQVFEDTKKTIMG